MSASDSPPGAGGAPRVARPPAPRAADKPVAGAGRSVPANASVPGGNPQAPAAKPVKPPEAPRVAAATVGVAKAGPRAAAAAARGVAASRERSAVKTGGGEAYPPSNDRKANGAASAPRNARHLTPRSPRTALEPDTLDVPPSRSRRARHPFVVIGNAILTFFILAAIAAGVTLAIGRQHFDAPGPLAEDRIVDIPRKSSTRDIADLLVRDGVIDQPWVFVGGVLVLKAHEDLKAGEYQFKAHASLRDVVATIVDGRVVAHQLTVPEGLTSEQIVARLLEDDVLSGNIKEIPREGTLLPDTYNFNRGITREQMIQRMQQAQQRLVKEIWDHRSPDLPLKTPDQLVILASLVEKETGKPEERTRVAAVFANRLKQRMRLQSDPTIIYGLVGGKGTLGRPIMRSEIDQPTPYNTYQIDGLPPGPIANPGRASLEAAANPARTRELYFVADGTGGHVFAETYEQHQRNVARLRAAELDQKDQATPDTQLSASPPPAAPPSQRRPSTHHNQSPQTAPH